MATGTKFGAMHSNRDLHLIQQKVVITPATPKTNYTDIPGADGSKDLTESLGVGVKYADCTITWTFALYPGDDWEQRKRFVSNNLNGRTCHIVLDSDPNYYYDGRLAVKDYKSDNVLKQITVEATCRPWMMSNYITEITETITGTYKTLTLENERKPVVPTITVSTAATIEFGSNAYSLTAGVRKIPDIVLVEGANTLKAKTVSGTGTIKITYQQGALI